MNNNETLFYQQEEHFWSAICSDTLKISENTISYFSELNLPIFNFIYLHQGTNLSEFEKAENTFKQQSKPYILVVHQDELTQFEQEIEKRGFIADGESTAMILPKSALSLFKEPPSIETGYRIEQCNERLSDWAQPLITAFPADSDDEEEDDIVINEYIRYHQRALDKQTNMMHFVLFSGEQPVSTLTVTVNDKTARLDDIGTDIQFQGKGFATILIKHALAVCNQKGLEQCVLEASSDGLSIYKKLGFEPIFSYLSFIAE
ncbi:GNAT family N-acetyltransferase [Providencia sp. PROV197]|uniref:GNAT family N-acetyltransferase n=1 Tax=Providencia sp. PROV197 TaxID=2949898 RepID=UPI002348FF70|nr:GNAT family N-acetyltransferase [Providencia sp. PROV197]